MVAQERTEASKRITVRADDRDGTKDRRKVRCNRSRKPQNGRAYACDVAGENRAPMDIDDVESPPVVCQFARNTPPKPSFMPLNRAPAQRFLCSIPYGRQ